jgi:hypothetical protein
MLLDGYKYFFYQTKQSSPNLANFTSPVLLTNVPSMVQLSGLPKLTTIMFPLLTSVGNVAISVTILLSVTDLLLSINV